MTKTYFDMGRRFTEPTVFTDIQSPKYEVHVDPVYDIDFSATGIREVIKEKQIEMYKALLNIVAKIDEGILESCGIYNYLLGNQPKTPNVDTGSGPIIDIKPEDYNVIDEQKLINGYK